MKRLLLQLQVVKFQRSTQILKVLQACSTCSISKFKTKLVTRPKSVKLIRQILSIPITTTRRLMLWHKMVEEIVELQRRSLKKINNLTLRAEANSKRQPNKC